MFQSTKSLLALACLSLLLSTLHCQNAPADASNDASANSAAAQAAANNATANSNAAQAAAAGVNNDTTAASNAASAAANAAAANNSTAAANNAAAAQVAANSATANANNAQEASTAAANNTAAANSAAEASSAGAAATGNNTAANNASVAQQAASNATEANSAASNASAAAQVQQGEAINSAEAANNSAASIGAAPVAVATGPAPEPEANNVSQSAYPPTSLNLYIIEPFFYSNDVNNQLIGHLFCHTNTPFNLVQCAIYDGNNTSTSRLLGIEYVINETDFNNLPASEKRFWHSHAYGVQNGDIFAPDIPAGDNYTTTLSLIANSYGKAVYLWSQTQNLPIGDPILAFTFTAPGQFNDTASGTEDEQTNTTRDQRIAKNANVTIPTVAADSDSWDVTGVIPVFTDINQTLPENLWGLAFPAQPSQ